MRLDPAEFTVLDDREEYISLQIKMSRFCSDNNNFPYDNNVLVLDMVLGSLWGVPQPINWDNVAKLVPGFTPKECARRFDELKSTGAFPHVDNQCNALTEGSPSPPDGLSTLLDTGDMLETGSSPSSGKVTGSKSTPSGRVSSVEKKERRVSTEENDKPQKPRDPNMVIHVCDETKNLKQDFTCPRDLLVKEMRYFAEYLSVDPQRWEEVDISVHCDVQIFDWLMNYVRRNSDEEHCDEVTSAQTRVLNDLLLHRDAVCLTNTPPAESTEEIPSSTEKVQDCDVLLEPTLLGPLRGDGSTFSLLKNWSLQLRQQSLLSEDEEYTTGSEVTEDEVGDEEELSKKQAAKKAKKAHRPLKKQMSSPNFQRKDKTEKTQTRDNTPFTVSVQKNKWDSSRSLRYNQDAQREEDQRRMVEIIGHLTKMRFGDQEQSKSKDTKEPTGGIYSRLEAQFKSTSQSRQSSEKTPRSKMRYAQIRTT